MELPTFAQYLDYRERFEVSRALAVEALAWAEPLARQALGVHSQRDKLDMGEELQYILLMTTAETNGGWGELMPMWFKPYERPLPIFVLDNWAMLALLWQQWLGDEAGEALRVENLLKIFLGGNLLIPFMPDIQQGGHFLRHGAFTIFLAILWLETAERDAILAACQQGAARFAEAYHLREQADLQEFLGRIEFEAFFVAEGSKIGGDGQIKGFLGNKLQFETYAALFGALSFSIAALHNFYGVDWTQWIYQKVNLDYRLARLGLEAWAKWLGVPFVEPTPDAAANKPFRADL